MEPEPLFLLGAGANPIWSEPDPKNVAAKQHWNIANQKALSPVPAPSPALNELSRNALLLPLPFPLLGPVLQPLLLGLLHPRFDLFPVPLLGLAQAAHLRLNLLGRLLLLLADWLSWRYGASRGWLLLTFFPLYNTKQQRSEVHHSTCNL